MKLYSIETGYFKLDGGAMFGVVPKTIWGKQIESDANNLTSWAMRSLLIEDGNKLILIDCGLGDKQDQKFFSHYYLHGEATLSNSLAALGFSPSDITDVILTHLHFDHCGGAIKREGDKLVPYFPNATFWSNPIHWNLATNPNQREKASFLKENILPMQESGLLKMIEIKEREENPSKLQSTTTSILDGLAIRTAFGHTEGMMLPQISYYGKTIIFAADLLPSALHVPISYVPAYDTTPLVSMQEKATFFNEAIQGDYILFLQHDPQNECCTLQQTEKGPRIKTLAKLSDLI